MSVPVKQPITINFAGGLDTKTDPWQVANSEFLALNEQVFTEGGRLTKRNGFPSGPFTKTTSTPVTLSYSMVPGTLTSGRKVFPYNNELCLLDGWNLYSWDANATIWNYKGRNTSVSLATTPVFQGSTAYTQADMSIDTTTGIKVVAYCDVNAFSVRYSIVDTATGQIVVNAAQFSGGTGYLNPRCVSIAGKSWVVAWNASDNKLYYQAIVGQTPTGSVTALTGAIGSSNPFFDIDVDPNTGNIYLAYYDGTNINISALSSSFVIGNNIAKTESATNGLCWFGDGTNIWVAYNNGTNTKAFIVNNAVSATTTAPFAVDSANSANVNNVAGVWSSTFNRAFIFFDQATTVVGTVAAVTAIYFNAVALSGGTATPSSTALFIGSLSISSKAFQVSGVPHICGLYTAANTIQPTNFLLNLYNVTPSMGSSNYNDVIGNIAAVISPDEAGAAMPYGGKQGTTGTSLPSVHQNGTKYEVALLQNANFAYSAATAYSPTLAPTGVMDAQFDFTLTNPDALFLGNNEMIAGGEVAMYDGANVCEQNFHLYPPSFAWSIATTGGFMGGSSNSLYSYIATYEWIDNQGQVHRSFPSPVVTPLASGQNYTFASGVTAGQVTVTLPTLRVSNKPGTQVVINLYRTLANGSVYYLVSSFGTVKNDPSVATITYIDGLADSLLQGNNQLYTTGAQGYYAPPATSALAAFKNRAINVASEDNLQFGYSNQVQQNFPVQFVPYFLQNIGSVGGGIVTCASMDDKLVLFKSGLITGPAIWYMTGQGPAPSGANSDFTDPLPIAVDAGLADRPSVVLTPEGLMFKSSKGIYLLDRGLQVSYIGAPVEKYNQYSVLSAQLIPNTTQVRFCISNGMMLVYDYFYKKWSTFTPSAAPVSDCIYQGQHTFVDAAGQVYREQSGVYYDGVNTPILRSFTTAWIKLAGLMGYQRAYEVFILGEYLSSHQMQVQVAYDYDPTVSQTDIITPDTTSVEYWRVFLAKQRCTSFQIQFTELSTGTPGAGSYLSGLNIIAGIKGPRKTISAANTVG